MPHRARPHSIWRHPHFALAVVAQFLYVAAQAGIFSFFINYMTEEVPADPRGMAHGSPEVGGSRRPQPAFCASATRAPPTSRRSAFVCFLIGRFTGAGLLKKFSAHKVLGLYGVLNVVACCLVVFLKLGWVSVACVFLSYFFMSIMFPTIFALGIFGLGARAKKASAFIVMAIMGGAILPKLMGYVADQYDMSRGFIVPMVCFAFVAFYGYAWPKASGATSMTVTRICGRALRSASGRARIRQPFGVIVNRTDPPTARMNTSRDGRPKWAREVATCGRGSAYDRRDSTARRARDRHARDQKGMFVTDDGRNMVVTFALLSSLFLLWGLCNGMIDVMDKHFQTELGLTKSQSAWVQFAHYLGYFLMALPAGWLATRLGYKGGIISGLLLVAAGGFWFVPATRINALAQAGSVSATDGVCRLPRRRLRHRGRPHVPGDGRQSLCDRARTDALRCDPHQPGAVVQPVGLVFGPIIGGMFFYSTDAAGRSTGSETLYIPYLVVAIVVVVLAVVFYFADMPDIKTEDDYHLDDSDAGVVPVDLEAPALRDGRRRAVPVRGGAGRHLQLLHQLHDGGSASDPGGVAHGPAEAVVQDGRGRHPARQRPGRRQPRVARLSSAS